MSGEKSPRMYDSMAQAYHLLGQHDLAAEGDLRLFVGVLRTDCGGQLLDGEVITLVAHDIFLSLLVSIPRHEGEMIPGGS